MSTALSVLIAESWKDGLNAATFSQEFTAERAYSIVRSLRGLKDEIYVSVFYGGLEAEAKTRNADQEEHVIQIGVQRKPAAQTLAAYDEMALLVEEIYEWVKRKTVTFTDGSVTSIGWSLEYLSDYKINLNEFCAVLEIRAVAVGRP